MDDCALFPQRINFIVIKVGMDRVGARLIIAGAVLEVIGGSFLVNFGVHADQRLITDVPQRGHSFGGSMQALIGFPSTVANRVA